MVLYLVELGLIGDVVVVFELSIGEVFGIIELLEVFLILMDVR